VVVTIPASFDETARELTIEAARRAGFTNLTLLEEPLAAFYAWLSRHETDWQTVIEPGRRVLVVDVGGGTSDFSFVDVGEGGALTRFAVGEHLLLGGDNIDMAVARGIEQGWGVKLSATEWSMLVQEARRAKEALLDDPTLPATDVTLIKPGSSIIAGTRKATLQRVTLEALLADGFYPIVDAAAENPRKAAGMRQMGLPYAAEPAVTRHLLAFLRYAARIATVRAEAAGEAVAGVQDGLLYPDYILFNGGSVKAEVVRRRIIDAIAGWFPGAAEPQELAGAEYSLAVARGAGYYGRVRRGEGVRVRGGIARAYYLTAASEDGQRHVCVMPRDTDENSDVRVPGSFRVQTNEKVAFTLHSSATRLTDVAGQIVTESDDISLVAPLVSVLKYGRGESTAIDVELHSRLTEVGALELTLAAVASEHRWPLRFDLRPMSDDAPPAEQQTVDSAQIAAARAHIRAAFTAQSELLKKLVPDLEGILDLPRDDWGLHLLRDLADELIDCADARSATPRHEARWLNLLGYCMRPGFGDAADELRLRQAWKWWFAGPANPRDPQALADWWVYWRRIAPGLKEGHQGTIAAQLIKTLCPGGKYRANIREGEQAQREMWRCLGALELQSVKQKTSLARPLLDRVNKLGTHEYWVLARLGARRAFRAPADRVVPAATVVAWVDSLIAAKTDDRMRLFALSRLAAHTGDRHLDLPDDTVARVRDSLAAHDAPAAWRKHLDAATDDNRDDQKRLLGDALPLGLKLIAAD